MPVVSYARIGNVVPSFIQYFSRRLEVNYCNNEQLNQSYKQVIGVIIHIDIQKKRE